MLKIVFRGPELAGFVILGATGGAVLANLASASISAVWASGTACAVLVPVGVALPWRRLARQAFTGWTSSAV